MNADQAYDSLVERLGHKGSSRLRRVMEDLMTPDQALMVAELSGSTEEVAKKTGFDLDKVKEALDELFFKGVVIPKGDFHTREYFHFVRSSGQLFESTMARKQRDPARDTEFYKLWYDFAINEFYPGLAETNNRSEAPALRVIPAYKSIKDLPGVLPWESYPDILRAQEHISTVPCACRYMETAVGHSCAVHDETVHAVCIQFGRGAQYAAASESGTALSIEEALELNEVIEDSGLIHSMFNNTGMTGFHQSCNCCGDCCMIKVPMEQGGYPVEKAWSKSRYLAYTNQSDCNGCQDCVERCPFDAIEMAPAEGSKKYKAAIDPDKCFGCGVCVVGCEAEALKMKAIRPPDHIPPAPGA